MDAAKPLVDQENLLVDSASSQYGRIATLSWFHFLNDGSANYLPGVLPAVLLALHQSVALAGTVMAALLIGQALQVVTGWFADHIGGRWFIIIGVLGSNVAAAIIGLVPSIWVLIPALAVIGISNAMFHPQAMAGARRLSGAQHGFGMALFLVGGELGRGLWPLFASVVVISWGLPYLGLLAVPALVSVTLLRNRLPRQSPMDRKTAPIVWRRHFGAMSALVSFSLLRALVIFGLVTYLPVLWHQRGHDLTEGASLITVLLVVGIVGNIGGGHFGDRINRRLVLFGSSLLGAILLAAFLLTDGVYQWILLGLLGITVFSSMPLCIVIGQDIFPENSSLGSGVALGLSNGLAAIALAGLDLVSTACGGPVAVLWVLVGAMLLATAISLNLPNG